MRVPQLSLPRRARRPTVSRPGKRKRSGLGGFVELVITVAVAVGLAFIIQAFIVKPYRIPSGSMIPTLRIGQRILVNRLAGKPKLGQIIVFHPPTGADISGPDGEGICGNSQQGSGRRQACDTPTTRKSSQTFVKRVVGLPGDHLRIIAGHVYRNGQEELGHYVQPCPSGLGQCTFPETIVVPAGDYYMMGDNRGESDDSRFWGPVPKSWVVGPAFFTYWPPDRIGTL